MFGARRGREDRVNGSDEAAQQTGEGLQCPEGLVPLARARAGARGWSPDGASRGLSEEKGSGRKCRRVLRQSALEGRRKLGW